MIEVSKESKYWKMAGVVIGSFFFVSYHDGEAGCEAKVSLARANGHRHVMQHRLLEVAYQENQAVKNMHFR